MTITQKKQIRRRTTGAGTENEIVGVINDFNDNVINKIFSFVNYWAGNTPNIEGTVYAGSVAPGWVAYDNPKAINENDNQFGARSVPSLNIPVSQDYQGKDVIDADDLWNSMKNIVKKLNNIRYFTAYWYHLKNPSNTPGASPGSYYLVNSLSGRGIFNQTSGSNHDELPDVTGGGPSYNTSSAFWSRDGEKKGPELNPTKPSKIQISKKITASDMNEAITNCFNEWYNKCYTNNGLVYTMYTCHLNCHSNCHNSRSRR